MKRFLPCLRSFFFCALVLSLVLSTVARAADLEQEMEKTSSRLNAQKKVIERLTQKERLLHKDVAKLEKAVRSAASSLDTLEKNLARLKKDQAQGAGKLKAMQAQREKSAQRLEELMRVLWPIYLTAREQDFVSANEWAQANRKGEWLASMYRQAQVLRADVEGQTKVLAEHQAVLDKRAQEVAAQVKKVNASSADLGKKRVLFERQLRTVRAKKEESEKEIQDLMQSLASLRHKITLQSSKQISRLQGKLSWPAQGQMVASFAPDADPASNGVGLSLAPGTPVRSLSWGKIVHNGQLRGFGQVVIVFHGEDYYSLYAFLSDSPLPVDRVVERGEPIGTCGYYPAAGGDGLYFELRFRQKVINPLKWLEAD